MTIALDGGPDLLEVVSDPDSELFLDTKDSDDISAPAGMDGMEGERERWRDVIDVVAKELIEEAIDAFLETLDVSVIVDSRLVNGDGASSSSLSRNVNYFSRITER